MISLLLFAPFSAAGNYYYVLPGFSSSNSSNNITSIIAGDGLGGGGDGGAIQLYVDSATCTEGNFSVYNGSAFYCAAPVASGGGSDGTGGWTNTSTVTSTDLIVGIGTDTPTYNLEVSTSTVNTATRSYIASILDNTDKTGTDPTVAYFSASNPSDKYPRAVFGIGHASDDVNTALTIYPEFGTSADPIPTHMFIQLAKAGGIDTPLGGMSVNNGRMVIFSTKYKGSTTGNPLVLSTQSYTDSNGLVVGNHVDQPIIIGPNYYDYGSQLIVLPQSTNRRGIDILGASGQSAELLHIRDNAGAVLFSVASTGHISMVDGTEALPNIETDGNMYLKTDGGIVATLQDADKSMKIHRAGDPSHSILIKPYAGIFMGTDGGFFGWDKSTSTVPGYAPYRQDPNTGIGWSGADNLSLITGGVEAVRITDSQALELAVPVEEDLRFPAGIILVTGASNTPDWETFIGNTQILAFSSSTMEQAFLSAQLPHSWKEGTNIEPHFHWSPSTTDTGNVTWCLEYTWANIDDVFPVVDYACVNQQASGTVGTHQLAYDISLDGTDKTYSSMLSVRLFRNVTAPDDTFTGDAGLLEFDIHYLKYRLGVGT